MRPRPILKPYTLINSAYSYQKFLKTRPKYHQTLKLERPSLDHSPEVIRAIGLHFRNLTKSTKYLHHLDLTDFPQKRIPYSIAKDIIKKFTKIKRFSQYWEQNGFRVTFISYLYLKYLKNLKDLLLKNFLTPPRPAPLGLTQLQKNFFRYLRWIKLDRLQYKLSERFGFLSTELINFAHYPSSLETLSFFCNYCLERIKGIPHIDQLLNFKHLSKLKKLRIVTALTLALFNGLLESMIDRLDQLKTLTFKISDKDHSSLAKTRALLAKCQGLESFAFTSDTWIDIFSNNEEDLLWTCHLKNLSIDIEICQEENLDQLGQFIHQQEATLETLSLQFFFHKDPVLLAENLNSFLEQLSRLKHLKTLRLTFGLSDYKIKIKSLPILPSLIHLINQLTDLRELALINLEVDLSAADAIENLFQALEQRSNTIEKLELDLAGNRLQKKDSEALIKTSLQCQHLHSLNLNRFAISDESFFEDFPKMVYKCEKLRSLGLQGVEVILQEYHPRYMLDMIERILLKRGIESFSFLHNWAENSYTLYNSCQKLVLSKLFERNPEIKTLMIPINMYELEFLNRWKGI